MSLFALWSDADLATAAYSVEGKVWKAYKNISPKDPSCLPA